MLQINRLKENPQEIINLLEIKNFDAKEKIKNILELDAKRRELQKKLDDNLAESNAIAKEIGNLFKSGKSKEADVLKDKTGQLKSSAKELSDALQHTEKELNEILVLLPNIPHPSIPKGKNAADNIIISEVGVIPSLDEKALAHWDITSKYNIIDFETGVKITGSGFPIYKGKGAKLQRSLISFFSLAASIICSADICSQFVVIIAAVPFFSLNSPTTCSSCALVIS